MKSEALIRALDVIFNLYTAVWLPRISSFKTSCSAECFFIRFDGSMFLIINLYLVSYIVCRQNFASMTCQSSSTSFHIWMLDDV